MKNLRYFLVAALVLTISAPAARAQSEAFLEALRLYYANDVKGAYVQMKKVVAAEPDNDAAYYYLSTMLRDSTASGQMLQKAVELDPHNYWYKYALAHNLMARDKNAEAADILEQLLAEHPGTLLGYSMGRRIR